MNTLNNLKYKNIIFYLFFFSFSTTILNAQTFNSAYFDNNTIRTNFNMSNICSTPINSGFLSVGSTNYAKTGYQDCFFQKIGINNSVNFTKYITSPSIENRNEVINDAIELSTGSFLVCGEANLNNSEPYGNASNYQGFIMLLSSNGSTLTSRLISNTSTPSSTFPINQCGFYKLLNISTTECIVVGYYTFFFKNKDYKALWVMNINPVTLNINWSRLFLPPFDVNNETASKNLNIYRDGNSNHIYISSSNNIYNVYTSNGNIRNFTSVNSPNNKVIDISGIALQNNSLAFSGSIGEDLFNNRNTAFVTYTDKNLTKNTNITTNITKRFGFNGSTFGNGNRIISINGEIYMVAYKTELTNSLYNYQPYLIKISNNILTTSSFNKSSYKFDLIKPNCTILNNNNSIYTIGFNTNIYGASNLDINNYFISNNGLNSINCNTNFNSVNEFPINILFVDPDVDVFNNLSNLNINGAYFPATSIPILTANKQEYNCCNNPELLQWGDFEDPNISTTVCQGQSQFLNGWRGTRFPQCIAGIPTGTGTFTNTSIGTEWFFRGYGYSAGPYGNRNCLIVQNTNYSSGQTFNISNVNYNKNVFLIDFEKSTSSLVFDPTNKTIWKQEFEISTLGDYLFCTDFGSVNYNGCSNNINVEILLKDLAANLTTSLGFYKSNNNCITSSTNNNLGYNDFCLKIPLEKKAYSIALVLRNTQIASNHDYSIDNISLKRICGDCPPNSNRLANNDDETIKKEVSNNTALVVFPNPSNSSVNFTFNVNDIANGTLIIYDYQGKIVNELFNNKQFFNGEYQYNLEVNTLPSGLYLAILNLGGKRSIQKFVVQH